MVHDGSEMEAAAPAFACSVGHQGSRQNIRIRVLHFVQGGNAKREAEIVTSPVISKTVAALRGPAAAASQRRDFGSASTVLVI